MSAIVLTALRPYFARMVAAVIRVLTLLAIVLMPLGMASASAMAHPVPVQHSTASMDHCADDPDQDKVPAHSSLQVHCAMCTALTANEPVTVFEIKPVVPRISAAITPFNGIELEIATPPPRKS